MHVKQTTDVKRSGIVGAPSILCTRKSFEMIGALKFADECIRWWHSLVGCTGPSAIHRNAYVY